MADAAGLGEGIVTEAATGILFRFVSPFDQAEQVAFKTLRAHAGGPVSTPPLWEFLVSTLGGWDGLGNLVGYVQFGIGPGLTFEYGLRVDPEFRHHGLGRRLFAQWLRLSRSVGANIAVTCAGPDNGPMLRLLQMAGFQSHGRLFGDQDLYVGAEAAFKWAGEQPTEELIEWPS